MARKKIERTREIFDESESLSALLSVQETNEQRRIPVGMLLPNRFNPRREYPEEALEELVQSMREHGFIGALDGRQLDDGRVELAYGSRRLLAARRAGISTIPVTLRLWDDNTLRFVALVENLVREDLTPLEQAQTVSEMHQLLGLSVREIARRIGKPKSWVEDRLALAKAPPDVRAMVNARTDALRVARHIARLADESSRALIEEGVLGETLTARQVQQAVQLIEEGAPATEAVYSVTSGTTAKDKLSSTGSGPTGAEAKGGMPTSSPPEVSARADTFAPQAQAVTPATAPGQILSTPAVSATPTPETVSEVATAASLPEMSTGGRKREMDDLDKAGHALARLDPESVENDRLRETIARLDALIATATRLRARLEERANLA
ncbi:MAG: ParB/RepB/Spo0J family partition protein [Anaerolineae bacterium]